MRRKNLISSGRPISVKAILMEKMPGNGLIGKK
jgi:hypothetical protein